VIVVKGISEKLLRRRNDCGNLAHQKRKARLLSRSIGQAVLRNNALIPSSLTQCVGLGDIK
jgi:hypothetical protein